MKKETETTEVTEEAEETTGAAVLAPILATAAAVGTFWWLGKYSVICGTDPCADVGEQGGSRMIGVSEGKDQEARAILELAGIDSDKYRIWHHNSIYVHAINEETKESVIVEKATLEVVKSPGALAGDPGHKNNISSSL